MFPLKVVTFLVLCHTSLTICEPVRYSSYSKQRHTPQIPVIPEIYRTQNEINPANTVQTKFDATANSVGPDCEPVTADKVGFSPFLPSVSPPPPPIPPEIHHETPEPFESPSPLPNSASTFGFEPSPENKIQEPSDPVSNKLHEYSSTLLGVTPIVQVSPLIPLKIQQNLHLPSAPEPLPPLSPPECTPSKITPEITHQSEHHSHSEILPPPPAPSVPPFLFGIPPSFAQEVLLQNPSSSSQPSKVPPKKTHHSGFTFSPSYPPFVFKQPSSFVYDINLPPFTSLSSNSIEAHVQHSKVVLPSPSPVFLPLPEVVPASALSPSIIFGPTPAPQAASAFAPTSNLSPHAPLIPQLPHSSAPQANQPKPEICITDDLKQGTVLIGSSHKNNEIHTGKPVAFVPPEFVPATAQPELPLTILHVSPLSPQSPVLAPAPKPEPLPVLPDLPPAKITPHEFAEHPGHTVSSTPLPPPFSAAGLPSASEHDVSLLSSSSTPLPSPSPSDVSLIDDNQVFITPVVGSTVYPNFETQTEGSVQDIVSPSSALAVSIPEFVAAKPEIPQSSPFFLSPVSPSPQSPLSVHPVPILETNVISGPTAAEVGSQFVPPPPPPVFLSPIVVPETDCIPNIRFYPK